VGEEELKGLSGHNNDRFFVFIREFFAVAVTDGETKEYFVDGENRVVSAEVLVEVLVVDFGGDGSNVGHIERRCRGRTSSAVRGTRSGGRW